jgi:hypothetical protein
MAVGTLELVPVEPSSAFAAAAGFFLFLDPGVDPLVFHALQLFDQPGVMRNPVDDVDVQETVQPLAGEVLALKAPGHVLFLGASSKPVPAVDAVAVNSIREASVASDFVDRITCFHGGLLQVGVILNPWGKVLRAGPAIDSTDTNQLSFFFFGFIVHFMTPLKVGRICSK